MINPTVVFSCKNVSRKSPRAVNAIPVVGTIRGSILSENLPAKGEQTAITTG